MRAVRGDPGRAGGGCRRQFLRVGRAFPAGGPDGQPDQVGSGRRVAGTDPVRGSYGCRPDRSALRGGFGQARVDGDGAPGAAAAVAGAEPAVVPEQARRGERHLQRSGGVPDHRRPGRACSGAGSERCGGTAREPADGLPGDRRKPGPDRAGGGHRRPDGSSRLL